MSVTYLDKPQSKEEIYTILNPLVKKWFTSKFKDFTPPQTYGILPIHSRENILISSSTGSGKCITPDQRVLIEEKGQVRIASGYDLISETKHHQHIANVDKTGKLFKCNGLKAFSLNENTIRKETANIYYEQYKGKIHSISTEYGRRVKVTPNHPLLVETQKGFEWMPAKKIIPGMKIGAPRNITLPEKEILFPINEAILKIKQIAQRVILKEDFENLKLETKEFTKIKGLTNKQLWDILTISEEGMEYVAKQCGVGVATVFNIIHDKSPYKKKEVISYLYKNIKHKGFEDNRVILRTHSKKIHTFTFPKKLTPDIAAWVAFIQSEGLIVKSEKGAHLTISQKNRTTMLKKFLKDSEEIFGVTWAKKNYKDYAIHSTTFCEFISKLLDMKKGRGREVPPPKWLLNSAKDCKKAYVETIISLEAEASKNTISIMQANQDKIETINYILQSFNIFPSVSTRKKYATNAPIPTKRTYYSLSIRKISNLKKTISQFNIDHPAIPFIKEYCKGKTSGEYVEKHRFDYSSIKGLRKVVKGKNKGKLENILTVCHRTGYLTETGLKKLNNILVEINSNKNEITAIITQIKNKLSSQVNWLKVKENTIEEYNGEIVDLSVPTTANYIGGFGGLFLHNTLTGFTAILNELVDNAAKDILEDKIYAIYVSPLKALGKDIQHNLLEPLAEMEELAGKELGIKVAVRTGDTTPYERQKMLKNTPHILITTPESLALMLISPKFKEKLRSVDWMIVDEIHALAENKRGVHLSLLMEHLQNLNPGMSRVGLSATVAPLTDVAQYLAGTNRDVKIAEVSSSKQLDLQVVSPVSDLVNTTYDDIQNQMYEKLHSLIQEHKTTLVFTNTRAGTERVVHTLKQRFPRNYYEVDEKNPATQASLIGAHHGSLSKEHRDTIEQQLRDSKLKAVVCSTSLELGIDIGSIDLVILLGSPKSVARFLQRTGRSGHRLSSITKSRLIVLDRDDLVECSVLLKHALEHRIDRLHIPRGSFDVLVQHILGFVLQQEIGIEELYELTKQSYCYSNLSYDDYYEIVRYLAGDFPALENRYIFAKIRLDENILKPRGRLTRMLYASNLGTIPSSSGVLVKIGGHVIGTIDEGFLEKLKRGDRFVLGGDTYEFHFARGMVAQVGAAYGKTPTIPNWYSESLPLSYDLAKGIQHFRGDMYSLFKEKKSLTQIISWINTHLYVDAVAAQAIYNYMQEQYLLTKNSKKELFPTNENIVVEKYTDDYFQGQHTTKKHYLLVHSLHGRRVNESLSRVFAYILGKFHHKDIEIGVNDNGFYLAAMQDLAIEKVISLIREDEFQDLLHSSMQGSEVIRRRFRQCAERSLMILRNYKGNVKNAGRQQVSSMILMKAAKKISENFIILRETYREVMEDVMDIDNAQKVFANIKSGAQKLQVAEFPVPSPFAIKLLLQGYSDVISIGDRHTFLQNMHKLVLAKIAQRKDLKEDEKLVAVNKLREISSLEPVDTIEKKLSESQEKLIKELRLVKLPSNIKAAIKSIIIGDAIEDYIVEELQKIDTHIKLEFPPRLRDFILQYLQGKDVSADDVAKPVNYESFWEKQKKESELKKQEEEFLLKKDFILAFKMRKTPYDVTQEVLISMDTPKKRLGHKAVEYFTKEFAKAIHKAWSDRTVKYIEKKMKEN